MSNNLLEKLQKSSKNLQKTKKQKLNVNSNFNTLTDEEISLVLALRAKNLRISQNKKQKEFSTEADLSSATTYSNFEQKGTISILNFIKVMRSFGRINELENLLKQSVTQSIEEFESKKMRVRK
ncbi:MAG: hypothetical protein ACQERD_04805 [Campylobacterota bacterium]